MKCHNCRNEALEGKTRCQNCADKRKEYRKRNLEKINQGIREWTEKNKNRIKKQKHAYYESNKEAHWQRNLKRYGITVDEYNAILSSQGGHCAICSRACEEDGKKLSVDHDHRTGQVRGILCARHNFALGQVGDDPETLINLVNYLKRSIDAAR